MAAPDDSLPSPEEFRSQIPGIDLVDQVRAIIKSRGKGRQLELERIVVGLEKDRRFMQLATLSLQVFSTFRGDNPTGVKAALLRRLGLAWIKADRAIGIGGGRDHIGYEFLADDAFRRRDWQELRRLASDAKRDGWTGPWDYWLEVADTRMNAAARRRRRSTGADE